MGVSVWVVAEHLQPTPVNTIMCIIGGGVMYSIILLVMREATLVNKLKSFRDKLKAE